MHVEVKNGKTKFHAETANTILEKMKGLMFSKKKNILFDFGEESGIGIHSFFVFFAFDAVYINDKKVVVEVVRQVRPFTAYVKNSAPARYLLEVCGENNFKKGDALSW